MTPLVKASLAGVMLANPLVRASAAWTFPFLAAASVVRLLDGDEGGK